MADDCFIEALKNRELYDHDVTCFEVIETHISWVLLTGVYAYKIKKPVNFGFLDFSSLANRRHYCYQELQLNQRFAPDIYIDVVSIGGTASQPRFATEPVIEYAVKMQQFQQADLLSAIAKRGELSAELCEQMAETLAGFHAQTDVAGQADVFGSHEQVVAWVSENFNQISPFLKLKKDIHLFHRLKQWVEQESRSLTKVIDLRKAQGFVRECHGDLHLGNMVCIDNKIIFFDCIEFNDELRWIDVINEAAFVSMDLAERAGECFSWHFLNRFLQQTGDYGSLALFRYYYVYRASVRAKVALLKTSGENVAADVVNKAWSEYRAYIDLAMPQTTKFVPQIILMHGFSGSGKSTIASRLADRIGAVHIRSDIERKRMHAIAATASSHSGLNTGIYSQQASREVYKRLSILSQEIAGAGYRVIVDATFLKRAQREQFMALARRLSLAFCIFDVTAPVEELKKRLYIRAQHGGDPSEADVAVLNTQLASADDLSDGELQYTRVIDNSHHVSDACIQQLADSLAASKKPAGDLL